MKPKLKLSSLIGLIMAVAFCSAGAALAATNEIEVGVTAVSVTNAVGTPPISPARDLETGLEVFFNEKIETSLSGRAQLLFRDGTSLTVGSSSEMTIDEYVFDPDTGTGELVINVSKGIFRLVGGKISKNTPVVFNTKTATVAVRGGIAMLNVNPLGAVQADFIYGQQMTLTSIVAATGESATHKTSRAGTFMEAEPNQPPSQVQKREPAALAAMTSALERPVKKPSPAAEESTPQPTESKAPVSQADEGPAETDKAEAAGTEPTSQVSQKEDTDPPPTEPGADTKMATAEPQADSEGIPAKAGDSGDPLARQVGDENPVREPLPGSDESLVMATPGDMAPANSENMPSDPSTSAGLPAREGTASNNLGASGTMPEGSLPTEASGIVLPSVDLTKTDPTKMPLVDAGLTTETENLTLAPLPAAYPASQPIQNLPRVDVSAMSPPDIAMNLQISSLVGKLGENVSTYIPPIGSPIGSNPSAVSREPVVMVNNIVIAVDAVAKAPGVKTDDGEYVTAPTGGYEHSTDYRFTGTTEEDKPTHFEYAATATTKCSGETCKSVPSHTSVATTCDPMVEYCPEPTKSFTTTSTTSETVGTIKTTTVACSTSGCEPVKHVAKPVKPVKYVPPVVEEEEPVKYVPPVVKYVPPVVKYVPPVVEEEEEPVWYTPPAIDRMGSDRATVTVGVLTTGDSYGLSATVSQAGAKMILVGDQIPLCHECRFLNWYRTTTRMANAHSNTVQIQHWIAGAVSTAAELAGAASKTASYSGGLMGSVASSGLITEKLGHFDARVRFGVSHYQVQNFNAAFDGRSYLGSSASTRNDALFNAVATSGDGVMNAQGYFFGNPTPGTPPPEIGGHFQVTGGGYDAAGVFAGAQH